MAPGFFMTQVAGRQRRRIMAFACIRLTGRVGERSAEYIEAFGERASWQTVDHDAREVLWRSEEKLTPGPPTRQTRSAMAIDEDWVLRPWMLMRWEALGIFRALLEIPGDSRRPIDLPAGLRHIPGVCEIYERHQGGVTAIVAYDSPAGLERIRRAVDELVVDRDVIVAPLRTETCLPTITTLEALATLSP
jgi:hypothetical protein